MTSAYFFSFMILLNGAQWHYEIDRSWYTTEQECIAEADKWQERLDPMDQYWKLFTCEKKEFI